MAEKPLTTQQEKFCLEIVKGANQSDALRVAYPLSAKWENKSVWEEACKVAAQPKIRARIAELRNQIITQPGILEAREVVLRISQIAQADLRKVFNEDGTIKAPHDIDDMTAMALVEYNGKESKAKLADRLAALRELLRHYQLLSGFLPPPIPPSDGDVIEHQANAHDWARRIAFTLSQGARKQVSAQPSS